MNHSTSYTLTAFLMALCGIFWDPLFFVVAIIIGACAFYWIRKEWKK